MSHAHHYIVEYPAIDTPKGRRLPGRCKACGTERTFDPEGGAAYWSDGTGQSEAQKAAARRGQKLSVKVRKA